MQIWIYICNIMYWLLFLFLFWIYLFSNTFILWIAWPTSCPYLIQFILWIASHNISTNEACLAHHRHQRAANGCLDQHLLMPCDDRGTWLGQHWNQRSRGAPRFLKQSRIMLVLPGAPFWHTIATNRVLLRADASTSIDSYLVCLGEPA